MAAGPVGTQAGAKTLDELAAATPPATTTAGATSAPGPGVVRGEAGAAATSWEQAGQRMLDAMREAVGRNAHHEAWCL